MRAWSAGGGHGGCGTTQWSYLGGCSNFAQDIGGVIANKGNFKRRRTLMSYINNGLVAFQGVLAVGGCLTVDVSP